MDRENSSTNNNSRIRELISRLDTEHRLTVSEYEEVLKNRTEKNEKFALETLFGVIEKKSGTVKIDGKTVEIRNPKEATAQRDRKSVV